MDEEILKSIASQLRQPHGEHAVEIGKKMNVSNLHINLNTIEALELQDNDNILEIGMGNGLFVKDVLSKANALHYAGCDFSESMIEESGKYNSDYVKSGQASFHLTNASQLPFEKEVFDKVFTINTIYFWENTTQVLSEIRRVLKPDGKITIAIRPKSLMDHYPFVKYGFNTFCKEDLVKLLSENQFKITDVLEKEEPAQEFNGQQILFSTLLISAVKAI